MTATAASLPTSTTRLTLRRFTEDDLEWLVDLYADVAVARFIGGVLDRSRVAALLHERILGYYDQHPGLGIWQTIDRATGEPIGFHLLNHIRGENHIQVGYALVRTAWGKGYASEMAESVVRYGFTERRLPRIVAIADVSNHASHHVLEKIGLRRNGERLLADPFYGGEPMAWFERDAGDWLAERERR